MKHLSKIDLFASGPSWQVLGQSKIGSSCGFVFTLSLLFIFIIASIFLSSDMVNKTNPMIIQSTMEGATIGETLNVSDTSYPIYFGMFDVSNDSFYFDETIFHVDVVVFDDNGNNQTITPIRCRPAGLLKSYPVEGPLICLKEQDRLVIDKFNGYISIKVKFCDNATTACKTRDEITSKFSKTTFIWYYTIVGADLANYPNPIKETWFFENYLIAPTLGKFLTSYISTFQLSTDSGIIGNDISTITRMTTDTLLVDTGIAEINEGVVMKVEMWNRGNLFSLTRRYTKIQAVLAEVVSIINVIVLVFAILTGPYSKLKFYEALTGQIFSSSNLISVEKQLSKRVNPESTNSEKETSKVKRISIPANDINQSEAKLKGKPSQYKQDVTSLTDQQIKSEKLDIVSPRRNSRVYVPDKQFYVTWSQWVVSLVKFVPKIRLLDQATKEIDSKIDISNIMIKMLEIDMLKQLLLNHDQRILFEHMNKPKLFIGKKNNYNLGKMPIPSLKLEDWFDSIKGDSVETSYQNMVNNPEKTQIDEKLIKKYEDWSDDS